MSGRESRKKKASEVEVLSWRQKKAFADKEEEALGREVEELISWTSMIEAMSDSELKEYVSDRPDSLKTVKTAKSITGKKVRRIAKSRSSSSSSQGLMAAVWKFHREDDAETAIAFQV